MLSPMNYFRAKWRRPKHKGVSGNFSTVVIITGVVIGSYLMTGGGYPEVVPTYSTIPVEADPLPDQPQHEKLNAMSIRELRFTQRPTLEPTPIPTFGEPPVGECSDESIAFLVDVSGSMRESSAGERKIDKLKTALTSFTTGLSDQALLAIYSFSEPFDGVKGTGIGEPESPLQEPIAEPRERQAMAPFGTIKATIPTTINSLEPYPWAATYMRLGLQKTDQWLQSAKTTNPDKKQTLIFISDGIPETDVRNYTVAPTDTPIGTDRSYSPAQDPTTSPSVAKLIQDHGVTVYSVVIYNPQTDALVIDKLRNIMKTVATTPTSTFYKESVDADTITQVLNSIRENICGT